jgi:hypothetical protein
MSTLQELWQEFQTLQPTNQEIYELLIPFGAFRYSPELRAAAADLLLARSPTIRQLLAIIDYVPERRDKAWELLRPSFPSLDVSVRHHVLVGGAHGSPQLRFEAARLLLPRAGSETLRCIIWCVPELREQCARQLVDSPRAGSPMEPEDYYCIIRYAPDLHGEEWNQDKLQFLSPKLLCCLAELPEWRQAAWTQFTSLRPTNRCLYSIIKHGDHWFKVPAAELLLSNSPSNKELRCIIAHVPTCREEAAALLFRQQPGLSDLECIHRFIPSLRQNIEPSLAAASERYILRKRMWMLSAVCN